ncbi:HET-domain-containing protein, partial [Hyaloscypha hepaticicola]
YVALSYCWGGPQPTITTSGNIGAHTEALPIHLLPKTICDAIEVTRKLGMRFLWVDALCIIQDDDQDKRKQIAMMGSIYKNATFTIAAASAEKVSDGFLSILTENQRDSILHGEPNYHEDDPLFSRGWTLQEMLLSPRLLIFDAYQLVLSCEEIGFEPAVPTGIGFEPLCERLPSSIFGAPKHHEILLKEQPDEEITTTWFSIQRDEVWVSLINEYNGRHLSIFDDRLPALSAIAHELSIFWGGTYVAGFWKEALIKHL